MKSENSGSNDSAAGQTTQVRCASCNALQFMSRGAWEECAIADAELAIKCWRRWCRRVIGLRRVATPRRAA